MLIVIEPAFKTDYLPEIRRPSKNRRRRHRPVNLGRSRPAYRKASEGRVFSAAQRKAWALERGYACS